ncbi:hypothetical protein CEUSTIGMA_g338.t1 [Chlamydomonas eustigma]|uniref:Uncharacterized protein n=1 Tax=Chlamydomonas eustigma TaxID=1157962 RepID=A0A250WPY6_9CHLO|nr:hypothetical protein CEUSTIGMA_g338.t1 [Chlamydomonas eustigma]|eukprot:GAX72883.1 hypothetical protein CEUSTIGMA_g338.t1 [Chlamydomonas eustigma]
MWCVLTSLTFFSIFLKMYSVESLIGTNTTSQYEHNISYIQDCGFDNNIELIEDLTTALKAGLNINETCICNPGLLRLPKDHWLVSFKIYWSADIWACTFSQVPGGSWYEWWRGRQGYALAVIHISDKASKLQVVSQWLVRSTNMEDARLFRDDKGNIRMMFNRHFKALDPPLRVSQHIVEVLVDKESFNISVTNEQDLIYLEQKIKEKNWIPWEGSSLTTYPNYPHFTPHSVLDWGSYNTPKMQLSLASSSPVSPMMNLMKDWAGWFRLSGGTPGVRLNSSTYVAVGHAVGDLSCFHQVKVSNARKLHDNRVAQQSGDGTKDGSSKERARIEGLKRRKHLKESKPRDAGNQQSAGRRGGESTTDFSDSTLGRSGVLHLARQLQQEGDPPGVQNYKDDGILLNSHACNASFPAPKQSEVWWEHHYVGHKIPHHHRFWDYFFYIYTWSANPPYQITHISHAFIPNDIHDHRGVYFPCGLQKVPGGVDMASLKLAYGAGDDRVMTLTITSKMLQEYLMPIETISKDTYKFCVAGRNSKVGVHTYT